LKNTKVKKLNNILNNKKKFIPLVILFIIFIINISFVFIKNLNSSTIDHKIDPPDKTQILSNYNFYRISTLVDNKLSQMSIDEKIGQLFFVSIQYNYLDLNTKSFIENYQIGGVVIMSNNISSQNQLIQLINELQNLSSTDLLIATDQEGGIVARIPWDEARNISQPHIGIVNREDFAYSTGTSHAESLQSVNIDINFAPVLDVSFSSNSIMANRSLGNNAPKVSLLGAQIIKAHQDNSIIPTAKHYPGIGRTIIDSHKALPEIDITKTQLLEEELLPFQKAVEEGIEIIMTGHVLYPQIDDQYPATLSQIFITNILRNELGYDGLVITDDINMQALDNYPNKAVDTINAGCDMILVVDIAKNQIEYIEKVKEAVKNGKISEERINESVKRILRLKYKYE